MRSDFSINNNSNNSRTTATATAGITLGKREGTRDTCMSKVGEKKKNTTNHYLLLLIVITVKMKWS